MTDVDLLPGTIAAKLRLLPDVRQLYPPRAAPLAVLGDLTGLVDAVAADRSVLVRTDDGTTTVETSLGVGGSEGATEVGLIALRSIRETLGPGAARIRVRIAAID